MSKTTTQVIKKNGKVKMLRGNSARGFIYSQRMKRNPTKAETAFMELLDKADIYYRFQSYFFTPDKLYIPDFRLLSKQYFKIIIEIDGSSHDGKEEYDKWRTGWLKKERNCQVFRFTNEQVFNDSGFVLSEIKKLGAWTNKQRELERIRSMPPWRYRQYLKEVGLDEIYEQG